MNTNQSQLFVAPPQPTKLYDLKWNNQNIITGAPYPVCNWMKTQLTKQGTHSKNLFTIKLHQ